MASKIEWYESEFRHISLIIHDRNCLDLFDFFRIRNFKLNNVSTEKENKIKKLTHKAFEKSKTNIEEALNLLQKLDGIGIPIASAILAMKFPNEFVIIDKNVILALRKKGLINQKKYKKWKKDYKNKSEVYPEYLEIVKKCKIRSDKD